MVEKMERSYDAASISPTSAIFINCNTPSTYHTLDKNITLDASSCVKFNGKIPDDISLRNMPIQSIISIARCNINYNCMKCNFADTLDARMRNCVDKPLCVVQRENNYEGNKIFFKIKEQLMISPFFNDDGSDYVKCLWNIINLSFDFQFVKNINQMVQTKEDIQFTINIERLLMNMTFYTTPNCSILPKVCTSEYNDYDVFTKKLENTQNYDEADIYSDYIYIQTIPSSIYLYAKNEDTIFEISDTIIDLMGTEFKTESCEKFGNGNIYRFKIGKNIKDEKIIPGLNERTQLNIGMTVKTIKQILHYSSYFKTNFC